jgi:hypothetical protein
LAILPLDQRLSIFNSHTCIGSNQFYWKKKEKSDVRNILAYASGTFNESIDHVAGGVWSEAILTLVDYNDPDFDSCRFEKLLVSPISSLLGPRYLFQWMVLTCSTGRWKVSIKWGRSSAGTQYLTTKRPTMVASALLGP